MDKIPKVVDVRNDSKTKDKNTAVMENDAATDDTTTENTTIKSVTGTRTTVDRKNSKIEALKVSKGTEETKGKWRPFKDIRFKFQKCTTKIIPITHVF